MKIINNAPSQSLKHRMTMMMITLWYLLSYCTYLLTYSMEQSPSWDTNRFSASQEILRILWKLKVH